MGFTVDRNIIARERRQRIQNTELHADIADTAVNLICELLKCTSCTSKAYVS